jgi:hypothetical protein
MYTLRRMMGLDLTSIIIKYSHDIDFHVATEENGT